MLAEGDLRVRVHVAPELDQLIVVLAKELRQLPGQVVTSRHGRVRRCELR
jgi:hypothetical protein